MPAKVRFWFAAFLSILVLHAPTPSKAHHAQQADRVNEQLHDQSENSLKLKTFEEDSIYISHAHFFFQRLSG